MSSLEQKIVVSSNSTNIHLKKKYGWKTILWETIKDSMIFIVSSVLSTIAMILLTVIVAHHPLQGAYAATSISYITVFQYSFIQLGLTVAMVLGLWAKRYFVDAKVNFKQDKTTIATSNFYALVFGVVMVGIYLATTFTYNNFANDHINTHVAGDAGELYLFASVAMILLAPLKSYLTQLLWVEDEKKILVVIGIEFAHWTAALVWAYLLGEFSSVGFGGYGLGLSIGYITTTLILITYHIIFKKISFHLLFKFNKHHFITIFKNTWAVFLTALFVSFLKMIALIILFNTINDKMIGSSPLDLQSARILWYQGMMFVQMFGLGFADFLFYLFQKQKVRNRRYHSRQLFVVVFVLTIFLTLVNAIIFGFSIQPLSKLYALNQMPHAVVLERLAPPSHFYPTFRETLIANPDVLKLISQQTKAPVESLAALLKSDNQEDWLKVVKPFVDTLWATGARVNPNNLLVDANPITQSFTTINATKVENYLTNDNTYIHVVIFSLFYPLGLMLFRYRDLIQQKQSLPIATLIIQTLAIAFVVGFGVDYQSSVEYRGMLAWSMPLSIIGGIILILGTLVFIHTYYKFLKEYNYNDYSTKPRYNSEI